MTDLDRLVAEYRYLHPDKSPRIDGRCACGLLVWSRTPCPKCGGFSLDRLREVLAESLEQKERKAC